MDHVYELVAWRPRSKFGHDFITEDLGALAHDDSLPPDNANPAHMMLTTTNLNTLVVASIQFVDASLEVHKPNHLIQHRFHEDTSLQ